MKIELRRGASTTGVLYTLREIEGEEVATEQMRLIACALAQLNYPRKLVHAQLTSLGCEGWMASPFGTLGAEESKVSFAPAEL
jgi:hypothetical protein